MEIIFLIIGILIGAVVVWFYAKSQKSNSVDLKHANEKLIEEEKQKINLQTQIENFSPVPEDFKISIYCGWGVLKTTIY
ncbi:MAG: hypothetical protein ACK4ON_12675 [Bacteroidia bacterium]